ncbi:unnamed protein product [Psylliodes chrysocephalus]|uniref:Uncharacterized protein n=1 Tax=Psylliodes chrysocephalus TaxID=3402493 RepID=A0A9P0G2D4_9CUCU|nr:unnamed protein product [Psylliodes chrysocephala]
MYYLGVKCLFLPWTFTALRFASGSKLHPAGGKVTLSSLVIQIAISLFDSLSTKPGISNVYLFEISKIEFGHPCQQFAKMYTIKLFIRLRIFYTLKYANIDLKSSKKSDKTKRKIKVLSHL